MSANDAEDRAWLERIMADPENIGLRLEFAGWLEGCGQSAVAELIRAQCHASLCGPDSGRYDKKRHDELNEQAVNILKRWQHEILTYFEMTRAGDFPAYVGDEPRVHACFNGNPSMIIAFCNGLPTSAELVNGHNTYAVADILKSFLLTEIEIDSSRFHEWHLLSNFEAIKRLHIKKSPLPDYYHIGQLANLEELILPAGRDYANDLPLLPKLKKLTLNMGGMSSMRGLAQLPALETLIGYGHSWISSFKGIENLCPQLRSLEMLGGGVMIYNLRDISSLSKLEKLEDISLPGGYRLGEQLHYIPDSVRIIEVATPLLAEAQDLHAHGRWPKLEKLNNTVLKENPAQAEPLTMTQEAASSAEPQEEPDYSEALEELAKVSERIKKFKRPADLGRSR